MVAQFDEAGIEEAAGRPSVVCMTDFSWDLRLQGARILSRLNHRSLEAGEQMAGGESCSGFVARDRIRREWWTRG